VHKLGRALECLNLQRDRICVPHAFAPEAGLVLGLLAGWLAADGLRR
jgi:hypothetical protein